MKASVKKIAVTDPDVEVTITMKLSQFQAMVHDLGNKPPANLEGSPVRWVLELYSALSGEPR